MLAGTAIVTLPCVLVFANVAYVDNLVLATYGVRLPGLPPAAAPRLVFPAAISFELAAGTRVRAYRCCSVARAFRFLPASARLRRVASWSDLGAIAVVIRCPGARRLWTRLGIRESPRSLLVGFGAGCCSPATGERAVAARLFAPTELATFRLQDFATLLLPKLCPAFNT